MAMRKEKLSSAAVAVAIMAVALLAAAAEAGTCNVDAGAVMHHCKSACSSWWWGGGATPSQGCCNALRYADFGCVCRSYWGTLRSTPYADCAMAIPSRCNIRGAPSSC